MNASKEIFSKLSTFQNSVYDDISEVKKRIGLVQDSLGETTILKQLQNDRKRARALLAFCTQTVTQLVELTNAIDDVIEKMQSVSQTAVVATANTTKSTSTTSRLNTPTNNINAATSTTQQIALTNRPITVTTTNTLPHTQNKKPSSQNKQSSPQESQNRVLTQNQSPASSKSASSSSTTTTTRTSSIPLEKRNPMQEQRTKSESDVLDLFFDNKNNDDTSAVTAKSKSINNFASEKLSNLEIQSFVKSTKVGGLEDDLFSTKENSYQKEEASKNLDDLFADDMFSDLMIPNNQTNSRTQVTKDTIKKQSSSPSLDVFDEYLGNETKNQQQQKSVELLMDFSDSGNKIVATNNILSLFDKSSNSFDSHSSTASNTSRTTSPTDGFDF